MATSEKPIETARIQSRSMYCREVARVNKTVLRAAYEVYEAVFGPQPGLVDGERGGFGTGELIAFLYARPFPRKEWSARVNEALAGMENVG